jgi:fumarate reductase subunit C
MEDVNMVDDLVGSLDGNCAIGVHTKNWIRALSMNLNFGQERIFKFGEFVDLVSNSIIVVLTLVILNSYVLIDAKLSFISKHDEICNIRDIKKHVMIKHNSSR